MNTSTPWYHSLLIGFTIGTTDAYVNHGLWAIKTRQQAKLPFTLNPRILYQGVVIHAATSAPMDMLQVTVSNLVLDRLLSYNTSYTKNRFIAGLIGGVSAALIGCPVELVMTHKQANLDAKKCLREYPYRGFVTTALRDSLFCCGFFAGVPFINKVLEEKSIAMPMATVIAGFSAGIITAVTSHPLDTLKTVMQSSKERLSLKDAFKEVTHIDGWKGLFTGLPLRTIRIASGIFILGTMNDYLEKKLKGEV